jgi:phosphoribosylanthranilate isomerase
VAASPGLAPTIVGVSTPPKIKFCGITSLPDAELALKAGAWAIGLIFWPDSPRACSLDQAVQIAAAVKRRTEVVGVFVNPTLDELSSTADAVGLTMLQLHGDEGPAFCAEAGRRTGCRVIKAVRVSTRADIQALAAFQTDYHLLDSHSPGRWGGTGETFSWELARAHRGPVPMILSGGLRADNVAAAIAATRPFAVDVASGVEQGPGRKDPDKLRAFTLAVSSTSPVAV